MTRINLLPKSFSIYISYSFKLTQDSRHTTSSSFQVPRRKPFDHNLLSNGHCYNIDIDHPKYSGINPQWKDLQIVNSCN